MPQVGNKKFPYTNAGKKRAEIYSQQSGQPMSNNYTNDVFNSLNQIEKYGSIANPSGFRNKPGGIQPRPNPQPINQPMSQQNWMSQQPYGGNISPNIPQGGDYW